jgi:aspartate aminotransferase-like enzyme
VTAPRVLLPGPVQPGPAVLRIGHMGEVTPAEVDACLAALDEVLRERV